MKRRLIFPCNHSSLWGGLLTALIIAAFTCLPMKQANAQVVSFTNDTSNACAPLTITFTNTSTGVDTAAGDYFEWWFGNDGPYFVYDTSYTFTQGGDSQVRLYAFDSFGGWLGNYEVNVYILGAGIDISADNACPGDEIYFTVDGWGESPFWDFGDGTTAYDWSLSHSYTDTGIYSVSLILYTNDCGWDTITQSIMISNAVVPVAIFYSWPNPVCPGDLVEFNTWGSAGTFLWDFGDGNDTTATVPWARHVYDNLGDYIVTMVVTNACGFSDSITNIFDTVKVENNLPAQGWLDIEIRPDSACPGDGVSFYFDNTDQFSGGFIWDFGDGSIDSVNSQLLHSYSTTGNYQVSITVTNGCGNDTTFFDTLVIDNNIIPNPQNYDYGPIPETTCPGDTILFYAEGGAASYFWGFGDGNTNSSPQYFDDSTGVVAFHAYADTGTYTVLFTLTNGCGNSFTDTFTVYIGDNVPVTLPFFGEAFGWLGDGNVSPTCEEIFFIPFVGGSTFNWNWGDGDSSTSNVLFTPHTYNSAGIYTITLNVVNSCGNMATFTDNITIAGACPPDTTTSISIASGETINPLNVYPNPFSDFINIEYTITEKSYITLEVFNALGEKVRNLDQGDKSSGQYKHSFSGKDIGALPGIYLVKLSVGNAIHFQRIIQIE